MKRALRQVIRQDRDEPTKRAKTVKSARPEPQPTMSELIRSVTADGQRRFI